MAHTASQRGSGSKYFLVYDDLEESYLNAERPRKTAQSNFHYRENSKGWKRGRSRRAPRQWARHKRGVGPIFARRMGNLPESNDGDLLGEEDFFLEESA